MLTTRTRILAASVVLAVSRLGASLSVGQQPQQRPVKPPVGQMPSAGQRGQAPAAATATGQQSDAARKEAILQSSRWRRAVFEMNEWLSGQPLYTPQQVEQTKANFAARVAKMSAAELGQLLDDMDAKFKILESPQAQDAEAWMAQYLSVLSTKKREEVLDKIPNIATMTADQLSERLGLFEQRRAADRQTQAAFQQGQQAQVQASLQQNRAAQRAYNRDVSQMAASPGFSPYTAPAQNQKPFSDYSGGAGMKFYVNPNGEIGYALPMAW